MNQRIKVSINRQQFRIRKKKYQERKEFHHWIGPKKITMEISSNIAISGLLQNSKAKQIYYT